MPGVVVVVAKAMALVATSVAEVALVAILKSHRQMVVRRVFRQAKHCIAPLVQVALATPGVLQLPVAYLGLLLRIAKRPPSCWQMVAPQRPRVLAVLAHPRPAQSAPRNGQAVQAADWAPTHTQVRVVVVLLVLAVLAVSAAKAETAALEVVALATQAAMAPLASMARTRAVAPPK
jgi:hypothetical protein